MPIFCTPDTLQNVIARLTIKSLSRGIPLAARSSPQLKYKHIPFVYYNFLILSHNLFLYICMHMDNTPRPKFSLTPVSPED